MKLKCLSVQQPWAWLLAHGHKDIENRKWPTNQRGWVLLHAGKNLDLRTWPALAEQMPQIKLPLAFDITRGAILGGIRIDDCVQTSASCWFSGPHGFVIGAAEVFAKPVPWRGALGFFTIDCKEPAALDILVQLPDSMLEGEG